MRCFGHVLEGVLRREPACVVRTAKHEAAGCRGGEWCAVLLPCLVRVSVCTPAWVMQAAWGCAAELYVARGAVIARV